MIGRREFAAAELVTRRALAVAPEVPELWANLATALWNLRRPAEAEDAARRALGLRPDFANAWGTLGLATRSLGRHDEAEEAYSRALEIDPLTTETSWNRSLLRIAMGDWARGFAAYEVRFDRRPEIYPQLQLPRWRGESLRNKSVLVVSEQGHGDTMLFSRFLPELAAVASRVVVCASLTMTQLLWELRECVEFIPDGVPLPDVDCYMYMGSLPHWYGLGERPPPDDPGLIARRVDGQHRRSTVPLPVFPEEPGTLKVGICWTGNPLMERNDERSVPLVELARLAEDPWVWLYSLQHGPAGAEVGALGLGDLVVDMRPWMDARGYVGTGCMVRQLDLVVTCCTSVAHLCGALGAPCWVLLCADPYWIWGNDAGSTCWYPSVRLFRRGIHETWRGPIDRVRDDLARLSVPLAAE